MLHKDVLILTFTDRLNTILFMNFTNLVNQHQRYENTYILFVFFAPSYRCCMPQQEANAATRHTSGSTIAPLFRNRCQYFGCLIDGEVFVPGKNAFSSYIELQCYYQFVSGTYVFALNARDYIDENGYKVSIGGNQDFDYITQGANIDLSIPNINSNCGTVRNNSAQYITTNVVNGFVKIKKLDYNTQIVSGVFNLMLLIPLLKN